MTYKTDEEPRIGDYVLGAVSGEPAAGKVVNLNEKKSTIVIARRGKSQLDARTRQMVQGAPEQVEAPASAFELVYRKEA